MSAAPSPISWIDYVTLAIAAVGAVLGIMNTWNAMNQNRVRLKVRPVDTISMSQGRLGFGIEVINLSAFPVTVDDVGFSIKGQKIDKFGRLSVLQPGVIDGKPWPRRLEAREAVSLYVDRNAAAGHGHKIDKAYAKTACGMTFFGDSEALEQLRCERNR
ncbi:MAG: hypothetical protein P4L50_11235 [Anaerolineaceae bacterium]|nr:hypothetical protein [Anaerolineaceae bacterium]